MSFDEKNIPSPFESSLNHFLSDDDKKAKFIGEKYEKYYKEKFERITPKKTDGRVSYCRIYFRPHLVII